MDTGLKTKGKNSFAILTLFLTELRDKRENLKVNIRNSSKFTYTSGSVPQRNHLYTYTRSTVCNPDTRLRSDRGWTHNHLALHTDICTSVEFVLLYRWLNVQYLWLKSHCTYFTVLAFEALWTATQVGTRLILTCPLVHAGLRQAFICVLEEMIHSHVGAIYV